MEDEIQEKPSMLKHGKSVRFLMQIISLDPADSTASSPSNVLVSFSTRSRPVCDSIFIQVPRNPSISLHPDRLLFGMFFPNVCFPRFWLIDKYCAISCTD
jgi:hypothetical protein